MEDTIGFLISPTPVHLLQDGKKCESSLIHALRNIRRITERNIDTGIPESSDSYLGNWIGAIGYMSILDLIGTCFTTTNPEIKPSSNKSGVIKALKNFNVLNLDDNQIDALFALRNAFTHNFSVINIPRSINTSNDIRDLHHFGIDSSISSSQVVIVPNIRWTDRNLHLRTLENRTIVNLPAFGNLVENIYNKLCELHANGELKLAIDAFDAKVRFSFQY